MRKYKAVVFVHGCFWHAHKGCKLFRIPKTRADFWIEKLRSNKDRDLRVVQHLIDQGYRIAILWECSIKKDLDRVVDQLEVFLQGNQTWAEISG